LIDDTSGITVKQVSLRILELKRFCKMQNFASHSNATLLQRTDYPWPCQDVSSEDPNAWQKNVARLSDLVKLSLHVTLGNLH
jgi:hypothetical protein